MKNNNSKTIENRFERKFVFNNVEKEQIISSLYNCNIFFHPQHEERKVNSIYFDKNYQALIENIEGISERKKTRLRWYGNSKKIEKIFIEKKLKKNFLSKKERQEIVLKKKLDIDNDIHRKNLFLDIITEDLSPIVMIHYKRIYLVSSIYPIRATIDYDLYSKKFLDDKIIHKKNYFKNIILELKYDIEFDEIFRKNINTLNIRFNKSSKYVNSLIENPETISL